ncbi:Aste57867_15097 [Aphanomyces stellatus]|uniref:Aste57867_15097 protein n=1 Tax=Aphanomyces stellatus TaxID=120398 RepID=A0A485L2E5_9STRA|nr:hypothetical protein As57867_015041 [Aphanomyces stellatus]VFT91910.1 Aste57867_15097 [Aphanomyces stellatus]
MYSQPIRLLPGAMSNKKHTLLLPHEGGPIAIHRLNVDIVEISSTGTVSVTPRADAYLHHALFGLEESTTEDPTRQSPLSATVAIGQGDETRGSESTSYTFDAPFAYTTDKKTWSAMIHVINTRGLSMPQAQRCRECTCPRGTTVTDEMFHTLGNSPCNAPLRQQHNTACVRETYVGGTACCRHDAVCLDNEDAALANASSPAPSTFYVRYFMTYSNLTQDIRPLTTATCCDATGDMEHPGHTEYDIPQCDDPSKHPPACTHVLTTRQTLAWNVNQTHGRVEDETVELVHAVGHQHRAGLGMLLMDDATGDLLCNSTPTYDHAGHVVGMSRCIFAPPKRLELSSVLRIVATYNSSEAHTGVMSIWFLAIASVPSNATVALTVAAKTKQELVAWAVVAVFATLVAAIVWRFRPSPRHTYASVSVDDKGGLVVEM